MPFAKGRPPSRLHTSPEYRKARAALVEAFMPGDPCCLCGHAILTARYIEAQHRPGTEELDGLCHGTRNPCPTCGKRCNQVDGAKRGRARQNGKSTNLRWLQVDNHPCPVCSAKVTWASQRCCSKACASEWQRMWAPLRPATQALLFGQCGICASVVDGGRKYCSDRCRFLAVREMSRSAYRKRAGIPVDAPLVKTGRPRVA